VEPPGIEARRADWLTHTAKVGVVSIRTALLIFSGWWATLECAAQTELPRADATVITVTGEAMPVSAAPASVMVLSREIIEQSHAENVGDILRQVPFLFVTRSGGEGALTTVTIRGGKPNFTLVMLDSIPLNDISDTLGGSFDFATLSTDNVDHIEIVRGPLSSLYGSEAVSGVINIISRAGSGTPALELAVSGGNFGAGEARIGSSGSVGRLSYSLSGSYYRIGEQIGNDSFRLGTVAQHTAWTLGKNKVLQSVLRYQNSDASGFPPNGGGPEYSILRDPQRVQATQIVGGLVFRHQATRRWLYGLSFDVFNRDQDLASPAILDMVPPTLKSVPSSVARTNFRRYRLGFSNVFTLTSRLTAQLNAGERREEGSSDGLIAAIIPDRFTLIRSTLGITGEVVYHSDQLTATLGLRSDKSPGFENVWSPRAGITYRLGQRGPRIRGSWGLGFKLPSFFALADQTVGNELLKPEYANSFDIGLTGEAWRRRLTLELTYFRNHYRDLVDFSAQLFQLVNRSEATTQGVEFASTLALNERLRLGAHLTYLTWDLKPSGEPLRDVPRWRSGLDGTWRITPKWTTRAESMWLGRRYNFQVPVPNQSSVGGYFTATFSSSYDLSHSITAFLRLDNLLDDRFHEFIGFPSPGITARAGLSFRIPTHSARP
jgi:vitamin B12 transporter